jgi:hypothetical protein
MLHILIYFIFYPYLSFLHVFFAIAVKAGRKGQGCEREAWSVNRPAISAIPFIFVIPSITVIPAPRPIPVIPAHTSHRRHPGMPNVQPGSCVKFSRGRSNKPVLQNGKSQPYLFVQLFFTMPLCSHRLTIWPG